MKKTVWIVVGLVVVIGAGILISRPEKSGKPEGFERTQEEGTSKEKPSVDSVASSAAGGEKVFGTTPRKTGEGKDTKYTKVESMQSGESLLEAGGTMGSDSPELSEAAKALLGQDGIKHNYSSLLKAINALDAEMSATDVAALREMLNFSNDQFPEGMRDIEINAVKNDVLDKLLRQKDLPEGLGLQLVEMAGNAENDPVWRDYCLQFFPTAWERIDAEFRIVNKEQGISKDGAGGALASTTGDVASTKELSAIHDAMFSALDERDATLAGTALIGLELLSRTHEEFDRELIVGKAVEIAGDEMASSASRLTALRLAAMTDDLTTEYTEYTEIIEAARSLAQTGETVLLRSAAIVTLGEVGTEADRELLVSYTTDDNRQIAAAAKMALEKMDQVPPAEREVASKPTTEPISTKKVAPILINQDV